jgi:secretion/DNA translocation related TadE-like protein
MSPIRCRRAGLAGDDGSATVWVAACSTVVLVIATVIVLRSLAVLARHRAESGADLAALAAAAQIGMSDRGCDAAGRIAARNGARLRSCRLDLDPSGRSGTVVVRVSLAVRLPVLGTQEVIASARAGRLPA